MNRSLSSGGILLLVLAFLGLSGFLSGNLDAWLSRLFSPVTPPAPGASGASTTLPTVGRQTTGATA